MPDLWSLALVAPAIFMFLQLYRAVRLVIWGSSELGAAPISRDTPEESLRRAKRRRVRAEHDLWDAEFAALSSRRLCSCGSPAHRSRH